MWPISSARDDGAGAESGDGVGEGELCRSGDGAGGDDAGADFGASLDGDLASSGVGAGDGVLTG